MPEDNVLGGVGQGVNVQMFGLDFERAVLSGGRMGIMAACLDAVRALRKDVAGTILYAEEKATWMAGKAIQALRGNGYINEFPTGQLWRDAKLYEIGLELFAETA